MTAPSPQVLALVTEPDEFLEGRDSHVDLVNRHLPEGTLIHVDPARSPNGKRGLSFQQEADGRTLAYYGDTLLVPHAVWYWPAIPHVRERLLADAIQRGLEPMGLEHDPRFPLRCRAVSQHNDALRSQFPAARWVNPPAALDGAADKPAQLRLAHQIGFSVPNTLQTSDPARAKGWLRDELQRGRVVMKSTTRWVYDSPSGEQMVKPTSEILPRDASAAAYERLRLSPVILQAYVEGADIRVTVVGRRVFAARVIPTGGTDPGLVRDYRYSSYRLTRHDLSEGEQAACVLLVGRLGLLHGELDFKLHDGELVFLEVQGDGAWGATELETEQPIGQAFARLLLDGVNVR